MIVKTMSDGFISHLFSASGMQEKQFTIIHICKLHRQMIMFSGILLGPPPLL